MPDPSPETPREATGEGWWVNACRECGSAKFRDRSEGTLRSPVCENGHESKIEKVAVIPDPRPALAAKGIHLLNDELPNAIQRAIGSAHDKAMEGYERESREELAAKGIELPEGDLVEVIATVIENRTMERDFWRAESGAHRAAERRAEAAERERDAAVGQVERAREAMRRVA